mmetsp:Transcript_18986/g.21275  ORF Transcript_18986/g.21275 Transcript_18986/m.21275 type:complete len:122 (+) Transcript_18986:476-841(+)
MDLIDYNLFVNSMDFQQYCEFLVLTTTLNSNTSHEELQVHLIQLLTLDGTCSCGDPQHSNRDLPKKREGKMKYTNKKQKRKTAKNLKKGKSLTFENIEETKSSLKKIVPCYTNSRVRRNNA